jgi:hypothetical protein
MLREEATEVGMVTAVEMAMVAGMAAAAAPAMVEVTGSEQERE